MKRPTCETCIHWDDDIKDDTPYGVCHRYPPVFLGSIFYKRFRGGFIGLPQKNWCGEHHLFKKYLESLESEPEHDSYTNKLSN
jgi:hypothetical protein